MRAAEIVGPGQIEIREQGDPQASRDLVVVQVLVAPLCTEFKSRKTGERTDRVGHEAAGIVVDAGTSQRVRNGDRVVVMPQNACGVCWLCQRGEHIHCPHQRDVLAESHSSHGLGTVAEYLIKADWLLIKVPDDLSLEHAAMACCGFGPTFTAHDRLGTTALDTVVVSGAGPVGLGGLVQGLVRGATVVSLETQPYRIELAEKLGAEDVIDPRSGDARERVAGLTLGRGAHGGIETSGAPGAARTLAGLVRTRGGLAVVAWTAEVTLPALVPSGLDVHGCWHWNHQHSLGDMWTSIRRAEPLIDLMVTHRLPMDEISRAMDIQDSGECGKVVLYPFGQQRAQEA